MNEECNFKKNIAPFTQVHNDVLNCAELSWKAKGLFAYLMSKPEGWYFSIDRIVNDAKDSRDSIRTAMKELEEAGLLSRSRQHTGRMHYELNVSFMSQSRKNPKLKNPIVVNSHSGKTQRISNKEIKAIKSISNKEREGDKSPSALFSYFLELGNWWRLQKIEQLGKVQPCLAEKVADSWAKELEKLHSIDGFSVEEIRTALQFALHDEFWKGNLVSLAGLRKKRDGVSKFEKVLIQAKRETGPVAPRVDYDLGDLL